MQSPCATQLASHMYRSSDQSLFFLNFLLFVFHKLFPSTTDWSCLHDMHAWLVVTSQYGLQTENPESLFKVIPTSHRQVIGCGLLHLSSSENKMMFQRGHMKKQPLQALYFCYSFGFTHLPQRVIERWIWGQTFLGVKSNFYWHIILFMKEGITRSSKTGYCVGSN